MRFPLVACSGPVTVWQLLAYSYRGSDAVTVSDAGDICSGASLPTGYTTAANGLDCDDTNPAVFEHVIAYADVQSIYR